MGGGSIGWNPGVCRRHSGVLYFRRDGGTRAAPLPVEFATQPPGEIFLGSLDSGVTYNGKTAHSSQRTSLNGAVILASRSEVKRGEWKRFESAPFTVRRMGSVAYKLALVSAGLADATFTLTPKNEWDVAAGAALVQSAGGFVCTLEGSPLRCNNKSTLISGLLACGRGLREELSVLVNGHLPAGSRCGG